MKRGHGLFLGAVGACVLAGCGSLPTHYYTLRAAVPAPERAEAVAAYSVVVGPVTVPAVVDRPQIVTYRNASEVTIAEQSRWAEPLVTGIPRVIAGNLALLLPGAQVSTSTQKATPDPDYRVAVDVQRFEPVLGEAATTEVLWTVRATKGGAARSARFKLREPVGTGDYAAIVAAVDQSLAAVSSEIATAIRSLAAKG